MSASEARTILRHTIQYVYKYNLRTEEHKYRRKKLCKKYPI